MSTKLILDSLRLADDGRVECRVSAPDGSILQGVIETTFFDEFVGAPQQVLTPVRKGRIVQDNLEYLENEAEKQWRMGSRALTIK